jgi:hypothetical protein
LETVKASQGDLYCTLVFENGRWLMNKVQASK